MTGHPTLLGVDGYRGRGNHHLFGVREFVFGVPVLDLDTTVAECGRLLVPRMADWCTLQLLRDGAAAIVMS